MTYCCSPRIRKLLVRASGILDSPKTKHLRTCLNLVRRTSQVMTSVREPNNLMAAREVGTCKENIMKRQLGLGYLAGGGAQSSGRGGSFPPIEDIKGGGGEDEGGSSPDGNSGEPGTGCNDGASTENRPDPRCKGG
ncbi:hypothetical protein GE061_001414 [Apolygus lucorum]|uniref:Uncharacterized protein n=1 Tax=Apolygus lucorum TaxID=248454 RepID=A0A8S9Y9K1_APOLU|nr:hypothetical protein GE061_001414 [Apolygus lucorum]